MHFQKCVHLHHLQHNDKCCTHVLAGPGLAVALIEEGEEQEDEADILVVTETTPAAAGGLIGQGAEGQGALVRNILEAEKALQACPHCC